MESLLVAVLSAALGCSSGLESNNMDFTELPKVCAAVYDEDLRKLRGGISQTKVIRLDMDRDGSDELLVWDGNAGTGGQGWHVFTKTGNEWRKVGEVFGDPVRVVRPNGNGLLISSPCGWELCNFDYYELEKGMLAKKLSVDVTYAKPVRTKPVDVKIRYFD